MLYVISSSPGERRACLSYLCTVAWLSPLPGRGALTPIYALKRARSGSDSVTVSTSPLPVRPRRYHHSVVCRTRFHEVARAAGAKRLGRKHPGVRRRGFRWSLALAAPVLLGIRPSSVLGPFSRGARVGSWRLPRDRV